MLENKDPAALRYVGKDVRREEVVDKLTGAATYVSDMILPGMLYAQVKKARMPALS